MRVEYESAFHAGHVRDRLSQRSETVVGIVVVHGVSVAEMEGLKK